VQEIEQTGSSCVAEVLGIKTKEYDSKEMLSSEFVQKAIELFSIKKVRIKSKV